MSLKKLAEEIQKNPDLVKGLIEGYSDVCDQSTAFFLQSIKNNVVYVIPSLILAFDAAKDSSPTTINRIAEKMAVGTIFELVSNDETYQYTGVNCNGDVTAVKLGTSFQKEFHGSEVIRRVF